MSPDADRPAPHRHPRHATLAARPGLRPTLLDHRGVRLVRDGLTH